MLTQMEKCQSALNITTPVTNEKLLYQKLVLFKRDVILLKVTGISYASKFTKLCKMSLF